MSYSTDELLAHFLQENLWGEPTDITFRLRMGRILMDRLIAHQDTLVARARIEGITWNEIAAATGLASRQTAFNRWAHLELDDDELP